MIDFNPTCGFGVYSGRRGTSQTFTFEVVVEKFDSKWVPFRYHLSWCKQRDAQRRDWLGEAVDCLSGHGDIPGTESMAVGERRRYRIKATLHGSFDYWGEYDEDMEFHQVKCITKRFFH